MLDNLTIQYIKDIQQASQQNKLVIFVGAGASMDAGVPGWGDFVGELAMSLPESIQDTYKHDYLRLAQIYKETFDNKAYYDGVKTALLRNVKSPNAIHDAILELEPNVIITTNYDTLLEQAALAHNRQYFVVSKDRDLPENHGEKLIVKMHGSLDDENIVLTEDDYYDYSRNFPLIRSFVISQFASKVVLFVGFSFSDINLKYILREIQSELGASMQRAYLLTASEPSSLELNDFSHKGINVLSIPRDKAQTEANELSIHLTGTNYLSDKGETLRLQLSILAKYHDSKNPIEYFYNFISSHIEELHSYWTYLRYALPEERRNGFSIDNDNLTLDAASKKELEELFKDKAMIFSTYRRYKEQIELIRDYLFINNIHFVCGHKLFGRTFYAKVNKAPTFLSTYFTNLDLINLEKKLKEAKSRSLSYTVADLELPYVLFHIGHFYEAYNMYSTLAAQMWQKRRYVLFFICLYNKYSTAMPAKRENFLEAGMNVDDIIDFHKSCDLNKELNNLPIPEGIKDLFTDLINQKQIILNLISAYEKQLALNNQQMKAEKGTSWFMNNDAYILVRKFFDVYLFCHNNFLIADNNTHGTQLYKTVAQGTMTSILTPKEHAKGSLDNIFHWLVKLILTELSINDFDKVVQTINFPSDFNGFPIDDNAKSFIESAVENIYSYATSQNYKNKQPVVEDKILKHSLVNLIKLINIIQPELTISHLANLIGIYWKAHNLASYTDDICSFLSRYTPSADAAKLIFDNLGTCAQVQNDSLTNLLSILTGSIRQNPDDKFDMRNFDLVEFYQDVRIAASLISISNEETAKALKLWITNHAKYLIDLVEAEEIAKCHLLTSDLFKVYRVKLYDPNEVNSYKLAQDLASMCQDEGYAELHPLIEELSVTYAELRFLMNPTSFDDFDHFDPIWLYSVTPEMIPQILSNATAEKRVLRFIDEDKYNGKQLKDYINKQVIKAFYKEH